MIPDVSIVIVSYNVGELLSACIRSLHEAPGLTIVAAEHGRGDHANTGRARGRLQQVLTSLRRAPAQRDQQLLAEVVIVDNASEDGSAAIVADTWPDAQLIANAANVGFAAATNQGIQASTGRYVLLLNPDTEVTREAVPNLVGFLEQHPTFAAAGAGLIYPDGSFQHSAFRFPGAVQAFFDLFPTNHRLMNSRLNGRYPKAQYERGQPFTIDHPLGACLAVRREAIDQVGLLDENFFIYCEEIDWCWRLRKAGWEVACVPGARVVHHAGASTRQFRDAMFVSLWRSRFRLFDKHMGWTQRTLIRLIVSLGLRRLRLDAVLQAARGEIPPPEFASRLAAYDQVAHFIR